MGMFTRDSGKRTGSVEEEPCISEVETIMRESLSMTSDMEQAKCSTTRLKSSMRESGT